MKLHTNLAISLFFVACLAGCSNEAKVSANSPVEQTQTASVETAPPAAPESAPARAEGPPSVSEKSADPLVKVEATTPKSVTAPDPSSAKKKVAAKQEGTLDSSTQKLTPEQAKQLKEQLAEKAKLNAEAVKIAAPNTEDWGPTTVTAEQLAEDLEKAIPTLKNTEGTVHAVIQTPDGTGNVSQDLKIRDANEFDIPFILVGEQPAEAKIISNGKQKIEQVQAIWQRPVKTTESMRPFLATGMGEAFERDFSQEVFSPITKIGPSWPSLLKHWSDPSQGYKITVEQRTLQALENDSRYKYVNFRIHAIRSPEAAKKLGQSEIAVVVDGYHSLPVSVQTSYTDPKSHKTWKLNWTIAYAAGKKFTDKDFIAPYKKKGKIGVPMSS